MLAFKFLRRKGSYAYAQEIYPAKTKELKGKKQGKELGCDRLVQDESRLS